MDLPSHRLVLWTTWSRRLLRLDIWSSHVFLIEGRGRRLRGRLVHEDVTGGASAVEHVPVRAPRHRHDPPMFVQFFLIFS